MSPTILTPNKLPIRPYPFYKKSVISKSHSYGGPQSSPAHTLLGLARILASAHWRGHENAGDKAPWPWGEIGLLKTSTAASLLPCFRPKREARVASSKGCTRPSAKRARCSTNALRACSVSSASCRLSARNLRRLCSPRCGG